MSSSLCPSSCSVPTTTISGTLTGGIQDISALLPLLGTEQCEEHVSSALTNGYLYAAATPMSVFGSLGLARAGFKTFLASVDFSIRGWTFNGSTMLSNMGFRPQGENLSLIMADTGKKWRYVLESRLDTLLEELHLDVTRIAGVSHKTKAWNTIMIALTGLLSSMSIVPYIYLNTRGGSSLSQFTRWSFPAIRAIGGFLTSTTMQLILQRRITTITKNWLSEQIHRRKRDHVGREQTAEEDESSRAGDRQDAEKGVRDTGPKRITTDGFTWALLLLLFLGDVASVVGYVGCFSVVQSADSSNKYGPVSWLCLEMGLSLFRFLLWSLNPKMDDAPPLEFVLNLNDDPPLPTCNRNNEQIWEDKLLPLTRASPFLSSITSFAGLIKHFGHPGLSLYYTLTRAGPNPEANENVRPRSAHERVLYITIFDHKERTTRVFTRDGLINHFYSAGVPDVDLEYGLLEAKLGEKIDSKNDPIVGDGDIQNSLVEHYQSLIRSTTSHAGRNKQYHIGNAWTMNVAGNIIAPDQDVDLGDGKDESLARDHRYLEQGRLEDMRKFLDVKRGEWIETYMRQVIAEPRVSFKVDKVLADEANTKAKRKEACGEEVVERGSNQTTVDNDYESGEVKCWLIAEWRCMEMLLVHEVEEWEGKLWKIAEEFIRSDEGKEKEREWKANSWKRFDANIRAMNERMDAAQANVKGSNDSHDLSRLWQGAHHDIQTAWQSARKRFVVGSPQPPIMSCRDRFKQDFRIISSNIRWLYGSDRIPRQQKAMESRLRKEVDDIEFRLGQGLDKCDQFWGSDRLVRARHSSAKWLSIPRSFDKASFSRALKTRNDVIYIDLSSCDVDWAIQAIRNLPSLTSVLVHRDARLRLRDAHRDSPLFVDTYDADLSAFLDNNQLHLEETNRTFIFISNQGYAPSISFTELVLNRPTLAISFFGPSSGNLTLRLRHCSSQLNATLRLTVIGFPTFKLPIPLSLTTNDITLHPHPSKCLSFTPDSRNNLIIQVTPSRIEPYRLQDIQLLDEAGHPYDPRPSEAPGLSQVSESSTSQVRTPESQSFSQIGTPPHSPFSLPAQHAESKMDDTSEGTNETSDVKAV